MLHFDLICYSKWEAPQVLFYNWRIVMLWTEDTRHLHSAANIAPLHISPLISQTSREKWRLLVRSAAARMTDGGGCWQWLGLRHLAAANQPFTTLHTGWAEDKLELNISKKLSRVQLQSCHARWTASDVWQTSPLPPSPHTTAQSDNCEKGSSCKNTACASADHVAVCISATFFHFDHVSQYSFS